MKKTLFILLVASISSCNNNKDTNAVNDSAINDNSGIENVNGNIPDTSNSITIDGGKTEPAPKDTTRK